jgi:hypothetical protein
MDEYNVVVGLPAAGSSSFRDELVEKDEALGLFVVLLQMFAEATYDGRQFNKLVVFDEAHKYIESPDLVAGLVEVVREMRATRAPALWLPHRIRPPFPGTNVNPVQCNAVEIPVTETLISKCMLAYQSFWLFGDCSSCLFELHCCRIFHHV